MPANRFNGFNDYGIGIGLRVPHYRHILEKKPVVDWFEIISENFMVDGGKPLEVLDRILEQYRVVQHGVSMYFGSADRPDRTHLRKLKALVRRTKTQWLSDHLCWGSADGTFTHDLLPMPYTFAAARRTAEKIREAWAKPFFINGRAWAARNRPAKINAFFCQDGPEESWGWL
jgi:hypothetical protein